MAIFLWFFVVTDVVYFYDIEVPLKVIGLNDQKALVKPLPQSVKVRFRGKGQVLLWAYFTLPFSESALFLDVSKVHNLQEYHLNSYFALHPDLVVLPRDFDMEFINVVKPDTVWVSLEERILKNVQVRPELDIKPAAGYMIVGGIVVSPDSIQVQGAATLVDQLTQLKTPPLHLTNVVNDIFIDLPLKINANDPLKYSQPTVRVSADIQSIGTREIKQVPVTIQNIPAEINPVAIPGAVDLKVEGGQDILITLSPENFKVWFDFGKNWSPEKREYALQVETPGGVARISSVTPKKVEIIQR